MFGVVEAGQILIEAQAQLGHGPWFTLVTDHLPFGVRTAQMLQAIANDPRIRTNGSYLPSSWRTLYELTRLNDSEFDYLLRRGVITPELTRAALEEATRQLRGADIDDDGEPVFNPLLDGDDANPIRLPPPGNGKGDRNPYRRPIRPLLTDQSPLASDERRELLMELGEIFQKTGRRVGGGIGFVRGEDAKRAEKILDLLGRPSVEDDDDTADDGDRDEKFTPVHILERVRKVFPIDLDPASCAEANETVGATVFYTKAQNGLKQKWLGSTFLNQPYSEAGKWANRLIEAYQSGAVPQAIMLTNAETGANWYQEAMQHCSAYCKIRGRLKFRNKDGTIGTQPRWSSVVFYFGPDPGKFMRCFQDLGTLGMPVLRVPEGEKWQPELTWKGPPLWSVTIKKPRTKVN